MNYKLFFVILLSLNCFSSVYSLTKTDSIYVKLFNFLISKDEIPKEYQKIDNLEDIKYMVSISELCSDTIIIDFSKSFAIFLFSDNFKSHPEPYFLLKNKTEIIICEKNDIYAIVGVLLDINREDSTLLSDSMLIKYIERILGIINPSWVIIGTKIEDMMYYKSS